MRRLLLAGAIWKPGAGATMVLAFGGSFHFQGIDSRKGVSPGFKTNDHVPMFLGYFCGQEVRKIGIGVQRSRQGLQ